MATAEKLTVWSLLRNYAETQSGTFTSQEALSWFRRHAPSQANEKTVRTHLRGACWNVGDRSQFARREPFLARVDRGVFRRATDEEIEQWRSSANAVSGDAKDTLAGSHVSATSAVPREMAETPQSTTAEGLAEWHTEAHVQSALVAALVSSGWRILSVANTATKEHGIDVVASRGQDTIGVEVKGFPSRRYADPARATETKRTTPSTQAGHWYAQAVLAAMRLRSKQPTWSSVIVLPDFPRYRELHSQTQGSLSAAEIEVWWIDLGGALSTS